MSTTYDKSLIIRLSKIILILIFMLSLTACENPFDSSDDVNDLLDSSDEINDLVDDYYNTLDSSTLTNDSTDNDNDSIATAEGIEFNITYEKSISTETDLDYYSIIIPANSTTIISLTNLTDDLDLYLIDSNNNILLSSEYGGYTNESITYISPVSATTLTLYIKVEGSASATSNYTLTATNVISSSVDGNDTITTAEPIELDTTYNKSISNDTDIDYYSIEVPALSTTTITLTNLTDNLDLYIVDNYDYILSSSVNSGSYDETITYTSTSLSTKTIYIKIEAYASSTSEYSITTSNNITTSSDNNDTIATADSIEYDITYNKEIDTYADADYYSIEVPPASTITINLTNLTGDIDLYLLNSDDTVISASENGSTDNELIIHTTASTTTNTLYIKVNGYEYNTSTYDLSVTRIDASESSNNDTPETADPIDFGTPYYGSISSYYDDDYCSITIPEGSTVTLYLTNLTADLDLSIVDINGYAITTSTNRLTSDETITYTSTSTSTYYIKVYGYFTNISTYTLEAFITTP